MKLEAQKPPWVKFVVVLGVAATVVGLSCLANASSAKVDFRKADFDCGVDRITGFNTAGDCPDVVDRSGFWRIVGVTSLGVAVLAFVAGGMARTVVTCPNCAQRSPAAAKVCGFCGESLSD